MNVERIITGRWKQNCYILHRENGAALVIDPGADDEVILDMIEKQELAVQGILNTHAHYDHVGAVAALKERYGAPFFLHSADKKLLKYVNLYRKAFDGEGTVAVPGVDTFYDTIDNPFEIGDFNVEVIPSPGHTPGGVCLRIGDLLFSGDTLFYRAVGRVDLPGGDPEALSESLKRLVLLPPYLHVYPGHGRDGILEDILVENTALQEFTG
jgi:glyoxylase-like metal-dependent hydrolase (beta-lactamase superfamily II)